MIVFKNEQRGGGLFKMYQMWNTRTPFAQNGLGCIWVLYFFQQNPVASSLLYFSTFIRGNILPIVLTLFSCQIPFYPIFCLLLNNIYNIKNKTEKFIFWKFIENYKFTVYIATFSMKICVSKMKVKLFRINFYFSLLSTISKKFNCKVDCWENIF